MRIVCGCFILFFLFLSACMVPSKGNTAKVKLLKLQLRGVGIMNFDHKNAHFVLEGKNFILEPRRARDFPINSNKTILVFSGPGSEWEVERFKRYILIFNNDHNAWEVEEVK